MDLDGLEESYKRLVFWFLESQITNSITNFPWVGVEQSQITKGNVD